MLAPDGWTTTSSVDGRGHWSSVFCRWSAVPAHDRTASHPCVPTGRSRRWCSGLPVAPWRRCNPAAGHRSSVAAYVGFFGSLDVSCLTQQKPRASRMRILSSASSPCFFRCRTLATQRPSAEFARSLLETLQWPCSFLNALRSLMRCSQGTRTPGGLKIGMGLRDDGSRTTQLTWQGVSNVAPASRD